MRRFVAALVVLIVACPSPKSPNALADESPAGQFQFATQAKDFVEVQRQIGSTVITCRKTKNTWIAGLGRGKRFKALSYRLKELRAQASRATGKQRKKILKKIQALRTLIPQAKDVCAAVAQNPDPNPEDPNSPPLPVELSLDPLSRPFTEDDLLYLLEKAGYGYNPRKHQYLKDLAASQGLTAVVNELLTPRPEVAGLEARLFERLDNNLRAGTTKRTNYTIEGMRNAAIELAFNTNNPVLNRLGWETFFGKWTVSDRVLTNQRQYEVFWQYRKLLGEFALNGATTLRDVLLEISKHPMMLWYLDNGSSTKGSPNENYAREIQELYSMGTHRWNDACTELVPNYYEEYEGLRQLGDIFQATLALTGWLVTEREIDGERYYRAAFSEEDHRPGEKIVYRGTPYERKVYYMEDVVEAILAHPGTAQGLANDLLKAYVTPHPPCRVVLEFARIIRAQGYNLRAAFATLLTSNLFYNPEFRDSVIKTPLQRTAQFVNALGLTYTDADLAAGRDPAILENEIGVNVQWVRQELDSMGMPINSPTTVFYYDEASFYSSLAYAEQVNAYWNIAADGYTIEKLVGSTSSDAPDHEHLFYNWWRPGGELLARDIAQYVSRVLRVPLTEDQLAQVEFFLNNSRNSPTQTYRDIYDNRASEGKLIRLYVLLAGLPGYFSS